jgi:hypothetical protein
MLSPGVGNNVTVVVARAAQSASKPCVTFKGPIITQGTLKFLGGSTILTGGVSNIVAPNTKGGQIVEFQGCVHLSCSPFLSHHRLDTRGHRDSFPRCRSLLFDYGNNLTSFRVWYGPTDVPFRYVCTPTSTSATVARCVGRFS